MIKNSKKFKEGEYIVSEGEKATVAYLINSGLVEVMQERDGRTVRLAELGRGAIFGEGALFGSEHYGANVKAIEKTEVLIITPEEFSKRIESSDWMMKALIEMLIDRLKKTNAALVSRETQGFMDIGFI